MAQIKKLTTPSVNYDTQQGGQPPAGATTSHPTAVTRVAGLRTPKPTGEAFISSEQQQQLQDKGGA